jgi:hypothetical protein
MGKKYLDTKQSTIEASVLDVWADSAEEQKAIRSAARMVVGEAKKDHRDNPHPPGSTAFHAYNKARIDAERKAKGEKPYVPAGLGVEPPKVGELPKSGVTTVPTPAEFDKRAAAAAYKDDAQQAKVDADKPGAAAATPAPTVTKGDQQVAAPSLAKKAAAAITTAVKHDKKPDAGPTVDIGKLPRPDAGPTVDIGKKPEKKAKKAGPWKDPDLNPDGTYGPRHKWSKGKWAGSDDPRFSSDPRAGRGEPQVAHYQHELAVHEAIRNAANRMISDDTIVEAPRPITVPRTRAQLAADQDKAKAKVKGGDLDVDARLDAVKARAAARDDARHGEIGEPVRDPQPKEKTGAKAKTRPDMTRKGYAATKYGGGETQRPMKQKQQDAVKSGGGPEIKPKTKPVMTKKQAAVSYGGGPEIGLKKKPSAYTQDAPPKKPTKPSAYTQDAPPKKPTKPARMSPGAMGGRVTARPSPGALGGKTKPSARPSPGALGGKVVTKPKVPAGLSTRKITRPGAKKTSSYIANVKGSKSSDPRAGRGEPVVGHYQPEDGDYMKEWHDKKTGRNRKVHRGDDRKVNEVTGDKEEYTKFFNSAMKKFGVTSPDQLKGDKQKEFYDYVDANWEGDDEKAEQVVRDFKVNSMRETLRQMWSQQNEEGSKDEVVNKSRKKTDTGGKPAVIDTKPKTGNPHY